MKMGQKFPQKTILHQHRLILKKLPLPKILPKIVCLLEVKIPTNTIFQSALLPKESSLLIEYVLHPKKMHSPRAIKQGVCSRKIINPHNYVV